jgi:serine/threonine protein kinase
MEKFFGGSLQDYSKGKSFGLREVAAIMKQVIQAIAECHTHHVAHGDIKEDQFVFSVDPRRGLGEQAPLKIVDFGLAKWVPAVVWAKSKKPWVAKGAEFYRAPEEARNEKKRESGKTLEPFSMYAPDVWAAGLMAYRLITGDATLLRPSPSSYSDAGKLDAGFGGSDRAFVNNVWPEALAVVTDKDIKGLLLSAWSSKFSGTEGENAFDFILKATKVKPDDRATADDLLKHPFLRASAAQSSGEPTRTSPSRGFARFRVPPSTHPFLKPSAAQSPGRPTRTRPSRALTHFKSPLPTAIRRNNTTQ